MLRLALISMGCIVMSSCSTLDDIAVVDHAPPHCTLIEELSFSRWCDWEGKVYPEDIKDFRKLAKKAGADTLECCRVDPDEVIIIHHGVKKSQLPPCIESRARYARAYRCGVTGRSTAPADRTRGE